MRIPIRIGTRGSLLAMTQARAVRDALLKAHPELGPDAVEIVPITTTGDRIRDRALAEMGGKGLFTKEIEECLLDGRVQMAVHSLKDVPAILPEGLIIGCVPAREDPRDVFLSRVAGGISDLPPGAVIGTASVRRQAQILRARPDLRIALLRGNIETRLRKLDAGEVQATLLAAAGLKRLGLLHEARCILDPDEVLPAVCQGALGIEVHADDTQTRDLLQPLNDPSSAAAAEAERAFLAVLEGSCKTPLAALAEVDGDLLHLRCRLLSPDGSAMLLAERRGPVHDAHALGKDAGGQIQEQASPELLAGISASSGARNSSRT